ncbi:MAG: Asp-tRNA(Asn)/Glu-tRNA(Gln) amidotransferase subunit GatA [Planctomycetota bacterium]|nr:MAG: Asp-tRNA(Asn)/Glu-tRNA(Gln) amidotransferase subunit GatA [Planctomycetota bacterium]
MPTITRQLHQSLLSGAVTSTALVQRCLNQIAARDGQVKAFLQIDADNALAQAAAIDARRQSGQSAGRFAGLPVGLKDNICVMGATATCGSRILENFISPYDSHVAERLKAEGAVLLGRTNLDEFAMGSSCENSAFAVTRNPWDLERAPGGSSGGSAAAVSAGMLPLSLGSDTGGSIRQPAALCGIVGMKPTYGRVSRYGLVAYASSLDQIGPFAGDVYGAALIMEAIAGHDRRDSTSVNLPVPSYTQTVDQPLAGLKIGVAREHFVEGLDPAVEQSVRAAIEVYRSLGATIIEVSLPRSRYCVAVYYMVASSEASSNLSRFDGVHYGHRSENHGNLAEMYAASRAEGFGDEVKRRIMLGTYALSAGYYDAYYKKALQVRRLIREDFDAAFQSVDLILSPVTPSSAFKIGELTSDPLAMYLQDIYTLSANLAGIPGLSIPCGYSPSGLPIGLQLLGPHFSEDRLLRAARMYESVTDWHSRRPAIAVD